AKKQGNDFIFEPLKDWLGQDDLVIANLEGPITENKSISVNTLPGEQSNFIFTFEPSLAKTLFDNNIRLVNLGNNHILNFGERGLEATRQYLSEAGVDYFGQPQDEPASLVKEIGELKIAFVPYNQFVGNSTTEGAKTIEEIKNSKEKADLIFVYAHWGQEYLPVAEEKTKRLARQFIEAGADLVVGTHPHVVQDKEEYQGKMIYYSLGNFIFDQYFSPEVMRGLAVKVKIDLADKKMEFEEVNLCLEANGQTIICGV
ncbi:MAG: CapA family protein, partial [bacterium]